MPTATDTTLRHLAMLAAIPVGLPGKSTARILAELRDKNPDFDVATRTIQRSLEQLSRQFPITSETRGRTNYWFWIEKDALTQIPAMTATTAFALCLAAEHLCPIMPPSALPKLDPYFRHARKILDGTDLGRWTDRTAIIAQGRRSRRREVSADVQEVVYEALMTNREFEVQYRGKHEKESKAIVLNPLGIVVRNGIVYLVATSWKYEDIRHYVLHRMSEPQLTDEPAKTPPDFRLADHLGDDGAFAYPASDEKLALRALFDAGGRRASDRKPPGAGPPRDRAGGRARARGSDGGRHRRVALVAGRVREFGGGVGAGVVAGGVCGGGEEAGRCLRHGIGRFGVE